MLCDIQPCAARIFLRRPNRFVAVIDLDGRETLAHVPNTGRCRELLIPGAEVAVQCSSDPHRRTAYTLIAVWKTTPGGPLLINLDSQAPNRVTEEALLATGRRREGSSLPRLVRREAVCGDSLFRLLSGRSRVPRIFGGQGCDLGERRRGSVSGRSYPPGRTPSEEIGGAGPPGMVRWGAVCGSDGAGGPVSSQPAYTSCLLRRLCTLHRRRGGGLRPALPGDGGQPAFGSGNPGLLGGQEERHGED